MGRARPSCKAVSPSASGHRTDGDSPAASPGGARRPLHTPIAGLQPSPPRRLQAPGSKVGVAGSPTDLTLGREHPSCPSRHGPQEPHCGHARPSRAWGAESCGGPGPPGAGALPRCRPAQPGLRVSCARWKSHRRALGPSAAPAHTGETPGMLPGSSPPPTQPGGRGDWPSPQLHLQRPRRPRRRIFWGL